MYKVYAGNVLIHDDRLESIRIMNAQLSLEMGKSGLFEFTIYADHPHYTAVKPLKTIIEVQRHGKTIFRGRVLDLKYGFYNEKQVTCEGELAFLLDSIVPPHAVSDSFSAYLDYIVGIHNAQVEADKRFAVGNVTVADFIPFEVVEDFDFLSSFDTINKRMVEPSGGILQVRHEGGIMYLDLLSPSMNISNVSAQQIKLGKNLLDIKRDTKGSAVFSGIIPLGAKINDTENRLDISSVNGGSYSISNATAVAAYGKIFKVVIFENITNASTLLSEARTYLAENFAAVNSIEITAADLSGINPALDTFEVGQWVELVSDKHFTAPQTFLVRKMVINLSRPAETKIEVGRTQQGLLESLGYTAENVRDVAGRLGRLAKSVRDIASRLGNATEKANAAASAASNAATKAAAAQTTASNAASAANSVSERVTVLERVQPYVIETGTTGIWKWKKFSDNTCEFFGKIPVTSAEVATALGGWFRGANLYEATAYEYPLQMTEAPALEMMFQTRNGLGALVWSFSQDAATAKQYLPQCYLIRPTTATGIHGNINIIGKGKL